MNNLVRLNEYAVLNKDNPIGYTYDISTCIAMLNHRENSAILSHIESNNDDNDINLQLMLEILNLDDDKIIYTELFTGTNTNQYNLHLVKNILHNNRYLFEVKSSFIDLFNQGSIGYNYNTNDYYLVDTNYDLQSVNVLKKTL